MLWMVVDQYQTLCTKKKQNYESKKRNTQLNEVTGVYDGGRKGMNKKKWLLTLRERSLRSRTTDVAG